jgi:lipoate synthase
MAIYNNKVEWRGGHLDLGFKSVAAGPLVRSSYQSPNYLELSDLCR